MTGITQSTLGKLKLDKSELEFLTFEFDFLGSQGRMFWRGHVGLGLVEVV